MKVDDTPKQNDFRNLKVNYRHSKLKTSESRSKHNMRQKHSQQSLAESSSDVGRMKSC